MLFSTLMGQLFPGKPPFTEKDIPSQIGKVFLVTGGNAGVGFEITKILYSKGAKVYIASRSSSKAEAAIKAIKESVTEKTPGDIKSLLLDLSDLTMIKFAVASFASQEKKLDVLWNNAGLGAGVAGTTAQGHEIVTGTNILGPYLLTKLLLPCLREAAKSAPKNSVRIIFTASIAIETHAPPGGIIISELSNPPTNNSRVYATSKVANWFLATEFSNRVRGDGIVSLCLNPGNLRTRIWESVPKLMQLGMRITLHPPVYGAYTNLWSGLSDGITVEDGGKYVIPWGKWHPKPREDILAAFKTVQEGGTGRAGEFWSWCEKETRSYV